MRVVDRISILMAHGTSMLIFARFRSPSKSIRLAPGIRGPLAAKPFNEVHDVIKPEVIVDDAQKFNPTMSEKRMMVNLRNK